MEKIAANVLDDSFETDLDGPSRDFRESSGNTSFAFMLALALIDLDPRRSIRKLQGSLYHHAHRTARYRRRLPEPLGY
jgi:hypothetical protein